MRVTNLTQNMKGFITFSKKILVKVGRQQNRLIVYENNNFFKIQSDITSSRILLDCHNTFKAAKVINFEV